MNEWLMNGIQDFIIRKVRKDLNCKPNFKIRYSILEIDEEKWMNRHYTDLASILDISTSMVKRLFKYPGHVRPKSLTAKTMQKIVIFLEYDTWEELERDLILHAAGTVEDDEARRLKGFKQDMLEMKKHLKRMEEKLQI